MATDLVASKNKNLFSHNSEVRVQVSVSGARWVFSSEAIKRNRSDRES